MFDGRSRAHSRCSPLKIQRQVAIALVVAVEEPPLLGTVQRIVRGVQVQPHRLRRPPVRLQEQLHQQPVQRLPVGHDLAVTPALLVRLRLPQLQPVQRARPGQGMPPIPRPSPLQTGRVRLARRQRQQRIRPQPVVVVQILVPQRQPVHPLRHQLLHAVFDPPALAPVCETRRDPARQIQPKVRLPQQKGSAVARQMPGVESRHHLATSEWMKWKLCRGTLCRHGTSPSV